MPLSKKNPDARTAIVHEIATQAKNLFRSDAALQAKYLTEYDFLRCVFRALDLGACHE